MAEKIELRIFSDSDYIEIYFDLTEEEYEHFKLDPFDFTGDRVYFLAPGSIREISYSCSSGEREIPIDKIHFFNPFDEDEQESMSDKQLCEKVIQHISFFRPSPIGLEKNIIVIERFHNRKEVDTYDISLDDEEFDPQKIQLIQDDGLYHFPLSKEIFNPQEDDELYNLACIMYDGKIVKQSGIENDGSTLISCYAYKPAVNDKQPEIIKLQLDYSTHYNRSYKEE